MPSATFESPELVALFTTYTAGPDSIGAHLAQAAVSATEHDPLLVVTGTDLVLYPGRGKSPLIEPYRLATRGFKELAAVSHLGPAVATLARLRELTGDDDVDGTAADGWRADAARLLEATTAVRAANSPSLWRDQLAVRAFAGREDAIAAMIDYSCALTARFLRRALADPAYLTMASVRRDYLEGPPGDGDLPVPFNRVMIATFYLTGMDIAHRLIGWLEAVGVDWPRAMVIFAGQAACRRPASPRSRTASPPSSAPSPAGCSPPNGSSSPRTPPSSRRTTRPETTPPRPATWSPGTADCGPACAPPPSSPAACSTATRALPSLPRGSRSSAPASPASAGSLPCRALTTGSPSSPGCGW